jgi:rhodanese-related sulfurtransferase
MSKKVIIDSFVVALLGILVGFTFNYARRDGVSIIKQAAEIEKNPVSESAESSPEDLVEPVWIELDEALKYFNEGTALFIDARDEEEYIEGHIQGAVNVPYGWYLEEHPDLSSFFPDNKILITYCDGADCESSIELAMVMFERGYNGIKIFFGGRQDWIDHNLPFETELQE